MPSIDIFVNSINVNINGNKIGNDKTGYNVPFELALAIIDAIIVDEIPIPKFPKINVHKKSNKFWMTKVSNKALYSKAIMMFIEKTKIRLNKSLPEKIADGDAISCNVNVVPRSSSETNALDNPDIAEKKIITQNNPPERYWLIFSCPIEKRITLIVTIINIARELIAYLVLISEAKSFLKSENADIGISISLLLLLYYYF